MKVDLFFHHIKVVWILFIITISNINVILLESLSMRINVFLGILIVICINVWSCAGSKNKSLDDVSLPGENQLMAQGYIVAGTMHYRSIETGCWQFLTKDSVSYEIIGNQVEILETEGLQARLLVKDVPALKSVCMVGKIVELVGILSVTAP